MAYMASYSQYSRLWHERVRHDEWRGEVLGECGGEMTADSPSGRVSSYLIGPGD